MVKNKIFARKRILPLIAAFGLVLATAPATVSAAQLTDRSLTLGSSAPSATTTHQYDFVIPSTDNVGSIEFEYCTTASGACTTPTGLDTQAATLTNQSGETGFTIVNTTQGVPYITRTASAGNNTVSFTLGDVENPSATNTTFYVRISTYTSTDTTGSPVDSGTVAASTANQMVVTASVDEALTFCTGTSGITTTSCAGATGTTVSLGALSISSAQTETSQLGASTNAGSGYVITVDGDTLTSGSYTITANTVGAASTPGTEQFGLNLAVSGGGSGTVGAGYSGTDYRFDPSAAVASAAGPTDHNLYTVTNLANIASSTEAGAYSTELTYVATATF